MNVRHLDLQHLRSFLAVAETLHFTSASRALGLGQSTVSQHIGRLEELLGCRLLHRTTKQVELTADGARLRRMAHDLLRQQDAILSNFTPDGLHGSVRLGITEDIVLTRFPEILGEFRTRYPDVSVNLTVALSYQLRAQLEAGELDMLYGMRPAGEPHGRMLWHEPLRWLHNGAGLSRSHESLPLVTFPDGSITRRLAIEALNQSGRRWHLAFVSENLSAVLAAIRAGYGIGAQPEFITAGGHVSILDDPDLPALPSVDFISVERNGDEGSPAAALRSLIEEKLPLLDPRGSSATLSNPVIPFSQSGKNHAVVPSASPSSAPSTPLPAPSGERPDARRRRVVRSG